MVPSPCRKLFNASWAAASTSRACCSSLSRASISSAVSLAFASDFSDAAGSSCAVCTLKLFSDPLSSSIIFFFTFVQEGMLLHLAESHLPGVPPTYAGKKGAYFPTLTLYPSTAAGCASFTCFSYLSLDRVSRYLGVTRVHSTVDRVYFLGIRT